MESFLEIERSPFSVQLDHEARHPGYTSRYPPRATSTTVFSWVTPVIVKSIRDVTA